MDELYLDNIDEFVNDHNKIVTYKWLSLTLGVHVNKAKQMLYHYLENKRKESSPQLHATYLVSGKLVDNGQTCHKVSIVREDQLEDFKSKMNLIVSVHIYSVQKALLKDSSTLYNVDYDALKDNLKNCSRYSAIQCAKAVPMSSVELQQARETERAPASAPQSQKSGVSGGSSVASKPSAKTQKGIMGMFSKQPTPKNQESSKEVKPEQREDSPTLEAPQNKPASKTNSMENFFKNQTKKPEKPVKEVQSSVAAEQKGQSSPPEEKQEPAAVEPQKDTKTDSRSKTKRIKDSDSEEEKMGKKKRRRIKRPEPDSSDEDVIPDSPQPLETREPSPQKKEETVQHSQGNSETKIRKRRRVLKPRMFLDEEGCMVTEKEYVSESYSETEDDVPAPKNAPRDIKAKLPSSSKEEVKKSQKKSSSSSQKGSRQASITGFFQKK